MNIRKVVFGVWILGIGVVGGLLGQQFQLQNVPNKVSGTYTLDSELVIQATFTVRHRGAASSYFVTFSAGQSGSFDPRFAATTGGATLSYQLYDSSIARNILKDLSATPAPQEVLSGSFPDDSGWSSQDLSFVVVVPPGQFPQAGMYQDTITLTLYSGTLDSYAQKAQRTFRVSVTMPSITELSLVPPGAPFNASSTSSTLNFGILETGKTQVIDVLVRSNQLYSLSLVSQFGNALRIIDPTDTSEVPLQITINGNPVTLTPNVSYLVVTSASPTPYAGTRYALSFTIQDADFPTSGDYSCVLTFTLQAQ